MRLLICLVCLVTGCGDDNFDFSRTNTDSNNTSIRIEYNESSLGQDDDDDSGNGSNESNPVCTEVQTNSGGFLSKPVSDSDGNYVLLFPRVFGRRFEKVALEDSLGSIELGKFSSFGNGERQHWRFSKPGGDYPAPIKITAFSENGECVWIVSNPSERVE